LSRSLYAETAASGIATPPLEAEARADVAIIGAGFTGLSAALHLATKGISVVVLEANEVGWGASGRNGGQVNPGLKFDPARIEQDFGAAMGGRMVALSGGAPQLVFDLIERHQILCEAYRGGTIRAARSDRHARTIQATAADLRSRGDPVALFDRARMAEATGTDRYVCGMLDSRGGQVNPLGYARGLARAAVAAGARIHGLSPALRMEKATGGWRVATPQAALTAEWLVLATNGYTDGLYPGLARSIVPVFSMIAASEPLPEALARAVMPSRAVLFEVAGMTVYYRLDANNRLLMGGRSPSRAEVEPGKFRYLIETAARLWPALRAVEWTHFWNGQLALTTDHYPHFHEPAPGVLAALAYNGRGVAMATAMGAQIAARVSGTRREDLSMPVTDLREIAFHGLWRQAASLRMVYGRMRDALGV
jgi:glycine/D-amino acid oxidase-like deaminating enzyme